MEKGACELALGGWRDLRGLSNQEDCRKWVRAFQAGGPACAKP